MAEFNSSISEGVAPGAARLPGSANFNATAARQSAQATASRRESYKSTDDYNTNFANDWNNQNLVDYTAEANAFVKKEGIIGSFLIGTCAAMQDPLWGTEPGLE